MPAKKTAFMPTFTGFSCLIQPLLTCKRLVDTLSLHNGYGKDWRRTHHYSLLALARQRLRDAQRGLDSSSQEWIETERLARSLGLDPAHLNIHIFRARSQFRAAARLAGNATGLIERRRGELRFGELSFRIVRGSQLEGVFQPAVTAPPAGRQDG